MKNNKYIISILAIFVLMFVSCKNFLNNNSIEKDLENIDVASKTAKLYFNVNGNSARNILPDTSLDNFSDFVLFGKFNDSEDETELGSWDTIQQILGSAVEISAGSWDLTLTAKRGEINFASNIQIEVSEGQSITASFVLVAAGTNNGIANITLRFPEKAGIGSVRWEFKEKQKSSYLDNWYGSIEGYYPDENQSQGRLQTLTTNSYTLQTELPAGKYIFCCELCTDIGAPIGSYNDYIVIQPGLESKLDYTIDYFEFTGITQAVSTEQGMLLTIDIPKGVEMLTIMRIKNYAALMELMESYQYNPDPNVDPNALIESNTTLINKQFPAKTTSQTTLQLLDTCGFEAGDELTYAVYFNMESFGTVIKNFTALYDGKEFPEFTTYPEFATEENDDGLTTKILISNNPVVDWKDNVTDNGYMLNFLNGNGMGSSMMGFLFPEYVVDSNTKEGEVNVDNLYAGPNELTSYRFTFDKDGWTYNCFIDMSNLSGAQLPPVLQGPPYAVATENGISINIYVSYDNVSLLRATSTEGPWETIKPYVYSHECFEYLDKYDLIAGTTYYYKVINEYGQTYGGDYFSATATVTKGPFATISTQPVLAVSEAVVATFVPGSFQIADPDDVYCIQTVYDFTEENNPSNRLKIEHTHYLMGSNSDYFHGTYSAQNKEDDSWISGKDNIMNLYTLSADNKKYIFSSACIEFYDTNRNVIKQLNFIPAQGYCPAEIQIPNRKIGLSLIPTVDGIVINISNIPEGATSLSISSTDDYDFKNQYYFNSNRNYSFNGNISSGTMSFTDKYVNNQKLYYYKVTANKEGGDSYQSDVVSATASGGLGEIGISVMPECTFDDTDNTITYTQPVQLTSQETFPEDTYLSIIFHYRYYHNEYDYNSGYYYYSGVDPDYPASFQNWGDTGTFIPYNASIDISFPGYSYYQDNVPIPPNSTLPQQVVVQ